MEKRVRLRADSQSIPRYSAIMALAGFELIDIDLKKVFWKAVDERGRHVVVETIGDTARVFPDWDTRHAQISIYRGSRLCEGLLHREVAYSIDDLNAFIDLLQVGNLDHLC